MTCKNCQQDQLAAMTNLAQQATATSRALGARRTSMASSMNGNGILPKVLIILLCKDKFLQSDLSGNWSREILEIPEIADLVVRASSLRIHWMGEAFTTNFEAKVTMDWSVTGEIRSALIDLIPAQTADGQVIGADVTNRASLGLNPRIGLSCRTGGASVDNGRVTAYLEIVLQT